MQTIRNRMEEMQVIFEETNRLAKEHIQMNMMKGIKMNNQDKRKSKKR